MSIGAVALMLVIAWPVAEFVRLRDALRSDDGILQYVLVGVPEERGRPALRLKVDGALQLVCQRCLGALEFPLHLVLLKREIGGKLVRPRI